MLSRVIVGWRSGFKNAWMFEAHPKETVIFAHFIEHGLAVPTSEFFRGILHYYSLQLVHLNPNGILHIAIFVHLCEVYLGMQPHFILFPKIFCLKPQKSQKNMSILGGASFHI